MPGSVLLAAQQAASAVFHAALAEAVAAYPRALAVAGLPAEVDEFRADYPDALPRFEAARLASAERLVIARQVVAALEKHLVWQDESGSSSLTEALALPAVPLPLERHDFQGEPGWRPVFDDRGIRWDGTRLAELGSELVRRGVMTAEAATALGWVAAHALDRGRLCLTGHRIAVLGAGAEMAPTRFWLEAGADVLWLDTEPPPVSWQDDPALAGRLYWPAANVDLLSRPQEALATLIAFSGGKPMHLGLYAYAPGHARELRLTGVMNALVRALPADLLASVTLLVSPTTPAALSPRDQDVMRVRLAARPGWEALLARSGLLGRGGGCAVSGAAAVPRTVVAIQGASYQAAQYVNKVLVAECWAAPGGAGAATSQPLRVSANTAAITRTRSLEHPVFAAAFGGAAAFGVETLLPAQSRCLNGLLAVRDWLHPELPVPGAVRVHGGIHTLPYPLQAALRVAAAIGFARAPWLLPGLFRK